MTAMLHCLVGDVADALRASLPRGWAAANDEGNLALIEQLSASRLLDEPGLMAMLLRRADEERITTAATARTGRREARVLQGLVSHSNGGVSAAAMALILARGRRRDRFGQCLVAFDDLPSGDRRSAGRHDRRGAARRPWRCAAIRSWPKPWSACLPSAIPSRSIDALTASLVRLLDENGGLDDDLILAAAHEGEVGVPCPRPRAPRRDSGRFRDRGAAFGQARPDDGACSASPARSRELERRACSPASATCSGSMIRRRRSAFSIP